MRDDAFDIGVIGIGSFLRVGQNVFIIEDVQAGIFAGAGIKIADGDDVEHVMVIFAAEGFFVPFHGAFQRIKGISAHGAFAFFDKDVQIDFTARAGDEFVLCPIQFSADNGIQVTGFGDGVEKHFLPASVGKLFGGFTVAVGNQDGQLFTVAD